MNGKTISVAKFVQMLGVPENLRDEIRQDIIVGLGKDNITDEEAKALSSVIKDLVAKKKAKLKKKATASVKRFKVEHKPRRLNICPICRTAMVTAYLTDGRPIYYCPTHRVALPVPVEG